mgnify:CR=1 FL=1
MFLDPYALMWGIFILALILGIVGAILFGMVSAMTRNLWNSWENAIRQSIKNLTK